MSCINAFVYVHAPCSAQVGEIEEQLAAARREVTKTEEANQKLQREIKEVRGSGVQPAAGQPYLTHNAPLQPFL